MAFQLLENDKYFYDSTAGDKVIAFIEKYFRHYEDSACASVGDPITLIDWQKTFIRDVFGWKSRTNNRRRFREAYLEIAKGNGKSPLLTLIALAIFFGEKAEGQQILSVATDFKQANITFDAAKKFIDKSDVKTPTGDYLSDRVNVKQYVIEYPKRNSSWTIISGTADGKHGFRPNVVLADELHEWKNRKLYTNVRKNMFKKPDSLMICATNAGSSKDGTCWELHEKAERVLNGTNIDESFYPVVYAAPKDADISLPKTWKLANPSMGFTITEESLAIEYSKAKESPVEEAGFRRFNLSQWTQLATRWLDMDAWDKCIGRTDTEHLKTLPLYLGVDLSLSDDMSAISMVWPDRDTVYVKTKLYMPRGAAFDYEDKESVPYTEWSSEKAITLLETDVIGDAEYRRFEKFILKLKEKYKLTEVCYDRWKANTLIARLEKKGITCVPVKQTFEGIGPATKELETRVKHGRIVLPGNPCLRWQAGNVEVLADNFGNIRPVKEHGKGKYAGRRGAKIDGIVSLITALSRAMKHEMREETTNPLANWDGKVLFL